FHF
ncbi:hypothetical protein D043_0787B, partial [Vibrio parahaemolyticus EKP-021]